MSASGEPAQRAGRRRVGSKTRWLGASPTLPEPRRATSRPLQVTDPVGDGNGPGNYAYPTASDFHPGAYHMTDFQVYDTGTTVMFRVQTGDLTPTFGSPLGGQLIDVYVHDPAASATSSATAFTQAQLHDRGGRAWSRMLEVQGFGQTFVDASGATSGTITISANQISRYITFSVTKAALGGTPSSGWGSTVTLTGQDGYSADNARAFTSTPGGVQLRCLRDRER
jgi:glucoamylase